MRPASRTASIERSSMSRARGSMSRASGVCTLNRLLSKRCTLLILPTWGDVPSKPAAKTKCQYSLINKPGA